MRQTTTHNFTMGLVGFGKIGQAVAAQILEAGLNLIAVDINPVWEKMLLDGTYQTEEPDVARPIFQAFQEGRLSLSTGFEGLSACQAVIVAIPLYAGVMNSIKSDIDFSPFDACFEAIAPHIGNKTLISLETTVPVGTCRSRIASIFTAAGKSHGVDYLLAHSPERIKSGSMRAQLNRNFKLAGGLTGEATRAAQDVYSRFIPPELVTPVGSIEMAEMVKLAGMVYRDVNIALANQLAQYCDAAQMDITEVIRLANTDAESNILTPGIGVGGHCTPMYPYFLMGNFEAVNLLFDLAVHGRRINDAMAEYAVDSACETVAIRRALILGLGFRPNVKEDVCSPAYLLRDALEQRGIETWLHDPLYAEAELTTKGFSHIAASPYQTPVDAVFLVTMHHAFAAMDFRRLAEQVGCKIFLDGRNAFQPEEITKHGIAYRGIGRGNIPAAELHAKSPLTIE